uniref:Uncharacterized protein n=1 Tax=Ascaris lumbricoides TaxID=6252 RepID=A0A0M3I5K8_ASCLU
MGLEDNAIDIHKRSTESIAIMRPHARDAYAPSSTTSTSTSVVVVVVVHFKRLATSTRRSIMMTSDGVINANRSDSEGKTKRRRCRIDSCV